MKIKILFLLIFFIAEIVKGQTPKFHWAFDLQTFSSNAIVVDKDDNVYITGSYTGTTDFDPSAAVYKLTSVAGKDAFVAKYDKLGNFLWVVPFGGSDNDYAYDIKIDKNNSLVVTGDFFGVLSFDSAGTKKYCYDNGNRDVFVLKLDLDGKYKFCKNLGGLYQDEARALALDIQGNIYSTGTFYGQTDLDPSPTKLVNRPSVLGSATNQCVFISKLDSNGNYIWGKYFATNRNCRSYAIDVDKYENVYVCGASTFGIDFNPDAGSYILNPKSPVTQYIAKLNKNGSFAWAKQVQGAFTYSVYPSSIKVDDTGNVYLQICGNKYSSIDSTSVPLGTVFTEGLNLIKLDSAGAFKYLRGIGRGPVGGYWWGGTGYGSAYYNAGAKFTFDSRNNIVSAFPMGSTVDVDPSDDSVFLYSKFASDIAVSKIDQSGRLLWAYNFGDTSGTAPSGLALNKRDNIYLTGTFSSQIDFDPGIDTIFSKSSTGGTFVHKMSSCQMKSSLNIAACNSYTLGAETYSESGVYKPIFIARNSCDSIVVLTLSITKINDSVIKTGSTLSALATSSSYQWVKCPTFSIIPGATSKTFTPSVSGDYAVIIKEGLCVDTSNCINVWGLGIDEKNSQQQIAIFPNPSTGIFSIQAGQATKELELLVYNNIGELILRKKTQSATDTIDLTSLPNGFYFTKILNEGQILGIQKLIKN